jgi:hypothetical protein
MFYLFNIFGDWSKMFFIVGTACLLALVIVTVFIPETNGRTVEEIYLTEIENNGDMDGLTTQNSDEQNQDPSEDGLYELYLDEVPSS